MIKKISMKLISITLALLVLSSSIILLGSKIKKIEPISQNVNNYINSTKSSDSSSQNSSSDFNSSSLASSSTSNISTTSKTATTSTQTTTSKTTTTSKPTTTTSQPTTTSKPSTTSAPTSTTSTPKTSTPITTVSLYDTTIMGNNVLGADQMVSYVITMIGKTSYYNDVKLNCTLYELATMFLEEGKTEGVRGDIAFVQSIRETGYFRYGGDVKWTQNNYGGIAAVGGGVAGASFNSPREGVRAKIQHLKAYGSTAAIVNPIIDPRFNLVQRGCAPKWIDLNGKWAVPGDGYGQGILDRYDGMSKHQTNSAYVSMAKEILVK